LFDGNLTSSWAESLGPAALSPNVVYFGSCEVFHSPLQTAVMAAGASAFIGGATKLLIGPSEEVFKRFWTKAMASSLAPTGSALAGCEEDTHYPEVGAHGMSGTVGAL